MGGGRREENGRGSISITTRSFLLPHASYETTTWNRDRKEPRGMASERWRDERQACMARTAESVTVTAMTGCQWQTQSQR